MLIKAPEISPMRHAGGNIDIARIWKDLLMKYLGVAGNRWPACIGSRIKLCEFESHHPDNIFIRGGVSQEWTLVLGTSRKQGQHLSPRHKNLISVEESYFNVYGIVLNFL